MYQITITTTVPPMIVVFSGTLTATTTVSIASTSLGLPGVQGQDNEFPPPLLIPVHAIRGVDSFSAVLQQQPPSLMHPPDKFPVVIQVYYASYAVDPSKVSPPHSD